MKKALPKNAKIAKDAKEIVQKCVSEFISFVTAEAADHCQSEKRRTVNGDDLLAAMQNLGFDEYLDTLRVALHRIRDSAQTVKQDRRDARAAAAAAQATAPPSQATSTATTSIPGLPPATISPT
ncbi:putative CCAAT-box binding factor HAP3 [Paratrimastix pyriformis]|uniref:CCAAT-box binding factor HAP3 n=1 Tax=Paratrimastix pyriformis TaxID=342808 RepID=A0ABQ8UXF7_9EUKA|nr:putative CCAAT-box binding factor HAP3 [Paratrimastix pyriformis]